ncbi:unnamed protein product [Pedinophyceae sp. YPF-701]|nr:unnamed protein product [Pedinophyceae sp. YPF-701]
MDVQVLEAHTKPGGCAHSFMRRAGEHEVHFDCGTSLFFGLKDRPSEGGVASDNPIAAVLDLLGEDLEVVEYGEEQTQLVFPEGSVRTNIGSRAFAEHVEGMWGRRARLELEAVQGECARLQAGAVSIHPMAVRYDNGIAATAALRSPLKLASSLLHEREVGSRRFGDIVRPLASDPRIVEFIDVLCRATSGIGMDEVNATYMVRAFNQLYQEGVSLEYPIGGGQAIVSALVRGLRRAGGRLSLRCTVDNVVVEGGRAVGVRLRDGRVVRARKAVVSNATVWDTRKLLSDHGDEHLDDDFVSTLEDVSPHESYAHLHAVFHADDAQPPPALHTFFFDPAFLAGGASGWPTVCVPSAVDPTAAPPGMHTMHSYLSEPYEPWEGLDPRSEAYSALKRERCAVTWDLAEQAVPGMRERVVGAWEGTPLTHERFLRRHRGTYGPRNLQSIQSMPEAVCPVPGLFVCGDSTFPGIGTPAAAASGMWVANTLGSLGAHWRAMDALKL